MRNTVSKLCLGGIEFLLTGLGELQEEAELGPNGRN